MTSGTTSWLVHMTCAVALGVPMATSKLARAEQPYQVEWAAQIGTEAEDKSLSAAVDGEGNAYISGYTNGSLGGTNAGDLDAFLVKFKVPVPGDLNGDGFVGYGDLNPVLAYWNQYLPSWNLQADPRGDGFVGIEDLSIVLGNWNAGTPPLLPIPEPTPLTLLALGGLVLGFRRPGAGR